MRRKVPHPHPALPAERPPALSTLPRQRPNGRRDLRLEFFGGPTLWLGNTTLRISPFQAGLLSLAFGIGQTRIPRSTVQRLLWPDDHDKAVRHRLSQLVYQTNTRCQTRIIELEGEHLRANAGVVATDLDELKEMIQTADFAAACDLIERGFLSAFPNRRTEEFSDWIRTQELAVRSRLRKRALADWNASEMVHDWAGARASAEALFRLDPLDEAVLRRVIRAHAMGGRVGEAEAVYRSFAERADPTGEWAPQEETTRLLKNVESAYEPPTEKSRTAKTEGPDLPLAGRANELSRLTRSICRTRPRDAWRVVTLSGEAGLGKTRLIAEATNGAQIGGCRVMYACPGEFERDVPLSPLLEALSSSWVRPLLSTLPDPWRSHLLSLLPQFDPDAKPPAQALYDRPEALRRHTCEAFLQLFAAIAQSEHPVVVLDDFHWADEATIAVLQFLHRRWRGGVLTLLLSYRKEELGRNEVAARLVNALEAEPESTAIRLQELESSAARELVSSMGSQKLAPATVDEIVTLAGGNPLFLIEIAAEVIADSGREPELRVPASVCQSIARRIGELAPAARTMMSALAVVTHPATVRFLTGITGHTQHKCIDALDLLHERRLVERTGDKVRIRQEIVRRTVYEGLSPTRRSLLHALAAEGLRSGARNPRPDRIAIHYHRAGERPLARIYALEAARPSVTRKPGDRVKFLKIAYATSEEPQRRRLALPLARALYRSRQLAAALRYGEQALRETDDLSPAESSIARLVIADGRSLLALEGSAGTLDRLADLEMAAIREGEDTVLAEVLDTALRLHRREDDHDGVTGLFARIKRLEGLRDPAANCRVLATLALQGEYGNPAEGLVWARRAVTIACQHNLHRDEMLARQRLVAALAANGLIATEEGRTAVAESRTAAQRSDDLGSYLLILLELAKWHTATGDLDTADAFLGEALAAGELTDCPEIRCLANLGSGNLALARGNLPAALVNVRGPTDNPRAASASNRHNTGGGFPRQEAGPTPVPPYLAGALAGLEGHVLLETGKFGQARTTVEAHAVEGSLTNVSVDLVLLHARLLSRRGDAPGALDLLGRGAEAHEGERPLHWLRLTLDLVRLARRNRSPRPDLAALAHDRAMELNLPGLAHEFVPFK